MTGDFRDRIAAYDDFVRRYHEFERRIDDLLNEYGGHTENMPAEALRHYRHLAQQRDDLYSMMRAIEQELFSD